MGTSTCAVTGPGALACGSLADSDFRLLLAGDLGVLRALLARVLPARGGGRQMAQIKPDSGSCAWATKPPLQRSHWDSCNKPLSKKRSSIQARVKLSTGSSSGPTSRRPAEDCSRYRR